MNALFFTLIAAAIIGAGLLWNRSAHAPANTDTHTPALSMDEQNSSTQQESSMQPKNTPTELEPISKFFGTIHSVNKTKVALWTLPMNSGH